MATITVQGTSITIPDSGTSPNWSQGIIQALELLASAVAISVGPYDITPQIYTMVSNANTNVSLTNLSFPTNQVRSAFIKYSVYRNTNSTTVTEGGQMIITYNGSTWDKIQSYGAGASVTFTVTNSGQVQFSSTAISGTGHIGSISYSAQCLLQS